MLSRAENVYIGAQGLLGQETREQIRPALSSLTIKKSGRKLSVPWG